MQIAFDATQLLGYSGINVYTRNLASHLAHSFPEDTYSMLTTYRKIGAVSEYFDEQSRGRMQWDNPFPHRLALGYAGKPLVGYWIGKQFRRKSRAFDLVHFTDPSQFPLGITRAVVTIHDLIPLYSVGWVSPETRTRMRKKLSAIARQTTLIFVPSEYVRQELLAYFDIDPARIRVTYESAGSEFRVGNPREDFLSHFGLPADARFFLSVGRIDPRKNLDGILSAYTTLPRDLQEQVWLLIIANGSQEEEAQLDAKIAGHAHIRRRRSVSNEELVGLLNRALGLPFVSFSEGFGIPLLEAMACGCPVITSNVSSMPEIAKDAALLVDPSDTVAIRDAMLRLIEDPETPRRLREQGLQRAQQFSWSRCAAETHAGYEYALGL